MHITPANSPLSIGLSNLTVLSAALRLRDQGRPYLRGGDHHGQCQETCRGHLQDYRLELRVYGWQKITKKKGCRDMS